MCKVTKKTCIFCEVCAHLFDKPCYTMFVNPNTLYSFCYTPISNKNTFSEKGQSHNCPFLRYKIVNSLICVYSEIQSIPQPAPRYRTVE